MPVASRNHTTEELAAQFKAAFAEALGERLDPPQKLTSQTGNLELCTLYEKLPHSRKRGIWPQVGAAIHKDSKWAAKHYLNTFKRALFPGQLTQDDKAYIHNYIISQLKKGEEKRQIISDIKSHFAQDSRKLFPDAVQSYAFQTFVRIEKEGQRDGSVTYKQTQVKNEAQNQQMDDILKDIFPSIKSLLNDEEANPVAVDEQISDTAKEMIQQYVKQNEELNKNEKVKEERSKLIRDIQSMDTIANDSEKLKTLTSIITSYNILYPIGGEDFDE